MQRKRIQQQNYFTSRFLREPNNLPVTSAQFLGMASETAGKRQNQRVNYRYNRNHSDADFLSKSQRARILHLAHEYLLSINNQMIRKDTLNINSIGRIFFTKELVVESMVEGKKKKKKLNHIPSLGLAIQHSYQFCFWR